MTNQSNVVLVLLPATQKTDSQPILLPATQKKKDSQRILLPATQKKDSQPILLPATQKKDSQLILSPATQKNDSQLILLPATQKKDSQPILLPATQKKDSQLILSPATQKNDSQLILLPVTQKKDSQPSEDKLLTANKQAAPRRPPKNKESGNLKKFMCFVCQKEFSSRQSKSRHRKRKHPEKVEKKVGGLICNQCKTFKCEKFKDLLQHQNDAHGQQFQVCSLDMGTDTEFLKWKKDLEIAKNCLYVKAGGDKIAITHRTTYYHCNRSGFFQSKGAGIRSLKSQGSSKMQASCCAFITKKLEKATGKVHVEYCDNHTHETEYSHLRISDEMRKFIADKLAWGADSRALLVEIRENATNERDRMIRHKDILNIKHQFNITEPVSLNAEAFNCMDLGIDDDDDDDVSTTRELNDIYCKSSDEINRDLNHAKAGALNKVSEVVEILKNAPNIEVVNVMVPYINAAINVAKADLSI